MVATHWKPKGLTGAERQFFADCPKAVLFEIARSFAGLLTETEANSEESLARLRSEWAALHANGIVPQKPR